MPTRAILGAWLILGLSVSAEALTREYTRAHKAALLHEALIVALPSVAPADIRVESTGTMVRITVPDTVTPAEVDAVMTAHNPALLSAAEVVEQRLTAARTEVRTRTFPSEADIDARIDALFPGPGYTDAQRTFFKRLARLLMFLVQERRLD